MVRGLECRSPRDPEKRKIWCMCLVKPLETVPYLTMSDHSWAFADSAFTNNCPFFVITLFSLRGRVPFGIVISLFFSKQLFTCLKEVIYTCEWTHSVITENTINSLRCCHSEIKHFNNKCAVVI